MQDGQIRAARPAEAANLSALALRSKAYWGYDPDFLVACIKLLTVTPEKIESERILVLEVAAGIIGFYGLSLEGAEAELIYLFVEPATIGRGYGKRLWQHAVETAHGLGARRLRIVSDPFAERFYLSQGADRIGETDSEATPGRRLPLLSYCLTRDPASGSSAG